MTSPKASPNPNRLRRLTVVGLFGLSLLFLLWFIMTDLFNGWWSWSSAAPKTPPPPIAEEPRLSDSTASLLKEAYQSERLPLSAVHELPPPAEPTPAPITGLDPALMTLLQQLADGQRETNAILQILIKAHERAPDAPKASKGDDEAKRRAAQKAYEERLEKAKSWKLQMHDGPDRKDEVGAIHRLKTPYALAPGTLIRFVTEAEVSNETRGPFRAFVSVPVCDSATHAHVVIPQMASLLMEISGASIFGDTRVPVAVHTLTFPNGHYVRLPNAAAGDRSGKAGFGDLVDQHYLRTFASAIFASGLRASGGVIAAGADSVTGRAAGMVATETAAQGAQEVRQYLRTDPTLTIRGGYEGILYLRDELPLAEPYPVGADGRLACGGAGLGG